MDTAALRQILLGEPEGHTGEGLSDFAVLTTTEIKLIYTIVDMARVRGKRLAGTALPDMLKARGVPKVEVVLAYRGDAIPA